MGKYLFVLGRNWRLALAELDMYLQRHPYHGQILDYSTTIAVVEFESGDPSIEQLGILMTYFGCIQKIARVYNFIDHETVEKAFPVDIEAQRAFVYGGRRYFESALKEVIYDIFPSCKEQACFIANSIYPETFDDPYYKSILIPKLLHYLNKFYNTYLKELGAKKAIYYKYPQENIDKGTLNPIFPHHFLKYRLYEPNRAEMIYGFTEEGMYIAKTITVVDANFHKILDEDRPYQDFRQSIPPKFAKMLLSFLSLPSPHQKNAILDPFCGSGTILQFAYTMDYMVYGTDLSPDQVEGTRRNLEYTGTKIGHPISPEILRKQISQISIDEIGRCFPPASFDGIATEPVLLPFYNDPPLGEEVQKIIRSHVNPAYNSLIVQAWDLLKPGARMAVVAPIIQTKEGNQISIPLGEMAESKGFKTIQILKPERFQEKENPKLKLHRYETKTLYDAGSKHIVREFFLFVKPNLENK